MSTKNTKNAERIIAKFNSDNIGIAAVCIVATAVAWVLNKPDLALLMCAASAGVGIVNLIILNKFKNDGGKCNPSVAEKIKTFYTSSVVLYVAMYTLHFLLKNYITVFYIALIIAFAAMGVWGKKIDVSKAFDTTE